MGVAATLPELSEWTLLSAESTARRRFGIYFGNWYFEKDNQKLRQGSVI